MRLAKAAAVSQSSNKECLMAEVARSIAALSYPRTTAPTDHAETVPVRHADLIGVDDLRQAMRPDCRPYSGGAANPAPARVSPTSTNRFACSSITTAKRRPSVCWRARSRSLTSWVLLRGARPTLSPVSIACRRSRATTVMRDTLSCLIGFFVVVVVEEADQSDCQRNNEADRDTQAHPELARSGEKIQIASSPSLNK